MIALLAGGLFWKKKGNEKNRLPETGLSQREVQSGDSSLENQAEEVELSQEEKTMEDWLKKCDAGEEIVFDSALAASAGEELTGRVSIDYQENQGTEEYYLTDQKGNKQKFSLSGWSQLDLLEGREVVLRGSREGENFSPFAVRCLTNQEKKNVLEYRRGLMAETERQLNQIVGLEGDFAIESFWWRDDEYFYVDFYQEDDEDVFYEALIFVKKESGGTVLEKVGVFKSSDDEDDWTTLYGRDLFEDADISDEDENYYEYDDLLKAWSPVY